MDFEKIKEQEILDKLRRQGLENPGETSIQESRNVLNILHENVLNALTLLHQVKDPSAMPRETRLRFVKKKALVIVIVTFRLKCVCHHCRETGNKLDALTQHIFNIDGIGIVVVRI